MTFLGLEMAKITISGGQICNRYLVFLREYAHIFPPPGGNLKIRGNIQISRGRSPREILIFPRIFKFTTGKGIYGHIPEKNRISDKFYLDIATNL